MKNFMKNAIDEKKSSPTMGIIESFFLLYIFSALITATILSMVALGAVGVVSVWAIATIVISAVGIVMQSVSIFLGFKKYNEKYISNIDEETEQTT